MTSDATASFLQEPLLTPQFDQPQFDDWINRHWFEFNQ